MRIVCPVQIQTNTYTLPAYWAGALINGDYTGLTDAEEAELDQWLSDNIPAGWAVDVSEETFFAHRNDANNMGADCAEFTFIVH